MVVDPTNKGMPKFEAADRISMVRSSSRVMGGQEEAKRRTKQLNKRLQGELIMHEKKKMAVKAERRLGLGSFVEAVSLS